MNPQILLVDDDAVQASVRCTILSRSGLKLAAAKSAQEALQLLEGTELRASLRLLITDHLMPQMNGPELVKCVRAMLPDVPVLVLSGLAEAEDEYENLQVCFRLKPFPPDELIRSVHLLVGNPIRRSA